MNFLTDDTPVWLTLGFFFLSILFTLLCVLFATDTSADEVAASYAEPHQKWLSQRRAAEETTVERIMNPTKE